MEAKTKNSVKDELISQVLKRGHVEGDRPLPVRQDTVGMFLDGYDYISNNPPGFAVSVAVEAAKEEHVQL